MGTATYLAGTLLEGCDTVRMNKGGNIIQLPMPGEDSDQTELFDFGGSIESYSVAGTFLGEESDIQNFITQFTALVDGNQVTTVAFTCALFASNQDVMIMSFDFTLALPGNQLTYSFKLAKGNAI